MATVMQIPEPISFSESIREFVVSSQEKISFSLYDADQNRILNETYLPDANGYIRVDISEVIHHEMTDRFPITGGKTSMELPSFKCYIEGDLAASLQVIKGRLPQSQTSVESFLQGQLLSHGPIIKRTSINCPEFISLYSNKVMKIYAKKDKTSIELYTLEADLLHTIDVSYAIRGLGDCSLYIDNVLVRTFQMGKYLYEYFFLYRNTLGGFDSLLLTGEREEQPNFAFLSAKQNQTPIHYHTEAEKLTEQNSGYFMGNEASLYLDFLRSKKHWIMDNTGKCSSIVLQDKARPKISDNDRGLHSMSFSFQETYIEESKFPLVQQIIEIESSGVFPTDSTNQGINRIVWS